MMEFLYTYKSDHLGEVDEPVPAASSFARTKWIYSNTRSWLLGKEDDDGKGASYTYTDAGRLATRVWARKNSDNTSPTTTYLYDGAGQLEYVTYTHDQNLTPDLQYGYDRLGRIETVNRNGALHAAYSYDDYKFVLTKEELNLDTGLGNAADLRRFYDQKLRPRAVALSDSGVVSILANNFGHAYSYEYDGVGRLETVNHEVAVDATGNTSGGVAFDYEYLANSGNLLDRVDGPQHEVVNQWHDHRNILKVKENRSGPQIRSKYLYSVNNLGQRNQVVQSGTAFSEAGNVSATNILDWTYNNRGELVSEAHSDVSAGNAYEFDGIGNRVKAVHGAVALPTLPNYVSNSLNQYSSVPNGGTIDHDDDGNLLSGPVPGGAAHNSDGSSANIPVGSTNLKWDGENRLVEITVETDTLGAFQVVHYEYDHLSRLIFADDLGVFYRYYDGWNMIGLKEDQEPEAGFVCAWTWGLDLSGSSQGAGGVGGLLATRHDDTDAYPLYDGNGNVCQYVDENNGYAFRHEYDSFGRSVKISDDYWSNILALLGI